MKKTVYIISAKRTTIGKKGKSLQNISVHELGKSIIKKFPPTYTVANSLIMGTVLQTGLGANIARQVALSSGLGVESTAQTVNMVCGSGLYAVHLASQKLQLNEANLMIAGGAESMSQAPNYGQENKSTLLNDALIDPFRHYHMGITAENVAQKYQISRKDQDEFAVHSHLKSDNAWKKGHFDSEVVFINNLVKDESIRPDTSEKQLATLKPVFLPNGTVTAGNAAPLSDGASFLLMANQNGINEYSLDPLAQIIDYQEVGFKPELMGYAPYFAVKKLLKKNKLQISDIDLFEINEAFAAQCIAVARDLNIPMEKLNISGGSLALGHPLGASGARILTTLVHNLKRKNLEFGIASLCIGGGMACAILVHNQ